MNQSIFALSFYFRSIFKSIHIIIKIAFGLSFSLDDTPRWLASKDRHEEARKALARLRNCDVDDEALRIELARIDYQIRTRAADLKNASVLTSIKELATVRTYRNRYLLILFMHTTAQWSGGNTVTYYVPQIFGYAGVTGSATQLISSGAYSLVKLAFTILFALFFIDYFGRRRCVTAGLFLQILAYIYLAIYTGIQPTGNKSASDAAIASIFVYAVGWSIGLCTIPYIYASEILPTRVRNVAYASSMWFHWMY